VLQPAADRALITVGRGFEAAVEPAEKAALLGMMAGFHLLEQGAAQRGC